MKNDVLDLFAINFIENHFDEIDFKKCDWNIKTKQQAINEIKNKDLAGWVIIEVMSWGTSIDYIKDYKVENDADDFIIKIDERYFALDHENHDHFKEVFPKKVLIEKLIFS